MKKSIAIIITLLIIVTAFGGCKEKEAEKQKDSVKDGKLSVVTTIFPPYDFARVIGGDKIDLKMLVKPGSESHYYEPSVTDIAAVGSADLFIYCGTQTDEWAEDMLESLDDSSVTAFAMADSVALLPLDSAHSHGDAYDEHVWTSPKNAINIVIEICEALIKLSPENEDYFSENALDYIEKLKTLDNRFRITVDGGNTKTLVFADRFPFRYLAESYGLNCFAAFSGCSAEEEAPLSTVKELADAVKQNNLKVVFTTESSDGNMAKTICDETGAKRLTLHSCHNLSPEDFKNGVTYLDIMNQNVENLKEALGS